VDKKLRNIRLTAKGEQEISKQADLLPGIWKGVSRREEIVKQILSARELYQRDHQYVIQEDKIVIVDEFTGRRMPNRSWSHGLNQAIEVKEGLEPSDPTNTMARLSFQRFFRLFTNLSGMTGTANEAAGELWHIYGLPILLIPTNRPCQRYSLPDAFFDKEEQKWQAIVQSILDIHRSGRPILVGTRNVHKSEKLAGELRERGIPIKLLNAVRDEEEASIVACAGQEYSVTIATNMAGRGTDIKLGPGIPWQEGLHVIATERHESGRIDRQLFGRCARQGDPGSVQAFVSLEDDILTRFINKPFRQHIAHMVKNSLPGHRIMASTAIKIAQKRAERLAAKQRKSVLLADNWFEHSLPFTPDLNF
jgi:preprotein translocase subunit SecA